ncbi:MAG: dihydropteroate synthase [Pseudobdellovibrionaceae bacterium]
MGIVNVTPDSFSDGGKFLNADKAIAHGLQLIEEGAHILDIGGESTRPGAAPVSVDEELSRILPVIKGLRDKGALISCDTRRTAVMEEALKAGADIINDVDALTDNGAIELLSRSQALICLMHKKGQPENMQDDPFYEDVVEEVYTFLDERIAACKAAGIHADRLMVDVGIGFGKTLAHNLALLQNLDRFQTLGVPVLLGASRKRFIAAVDPKAKDPEDRLGGSLSAALLGYSQGAHIFRVHDVAATRQALAVYSAVITH